MAGSSGSGGIGFVGLLTILFITLKLTKVISWSWWLVLSPVLLAMLLGVILIVVAVWASK